MMRLPNIGPVELLLLIVIIALVVVALARLRGPRPRADGSDPNGIPQDLLGEEVILRTYWAAKPADAIRWYQRDLDNLVEHGYLPATQSWTPGEWGFRTFLVVLLLGATGIGLVVLAYAVIVKPPGTLTATYILRDAALPGGPQRTLATRLAELDEARRAALITDLEHATRRESLLRDH